MSEDQPKISVSDTGENLTKNEDQVEDNAKSSSTFSWFSSIIQSAKETVNKTTFDSIKRDLSEFRNAVQSDTTSMMYSTASLVKNTITEIGNTVNDIGSFEMGQEENEIENTDSEGKHENEKNDISSIKNEETEQELSQSAFLDLETINTWRNKFTDTAKSTINIVKDTLVDSIFANFAIEELDDEPFVVRNNQVIEIKNWKQLIHQLQIDPNTYYREPSGPPENFESWLVKFSLINHQKQIEYLLESVPEINKYHKELVPHKICENDFWNRYFYNIHLLKEEQARLIQQEQQSTNSTKSTIDQIEIPSKNDDAKNMISRSSTDEWEKMNDPPTDSKCSSDDDRDWIKCD